MKLTRRELAIALAPRAALAQTPSATPAAPAAHDELASARARVKSNGELLARQTVPMDTEPAFQFQA